MNEHAGTNQTETNANLSSWKAIVAKYQKPAAWRGIWQLVNTLVPYAGLWVLMYFTRGVSYWLTVPLAILAGGFLVRLFIIFHDCGHGSFFKSRLANDVLGSLLGVLVFTPYYHWRWEHSIHHSTAGDLDRRGTGDVWTLTVQEYLEASRWKRFAYRLARNPVILFVIAPLFLFCIRERFPTAKAPLRERLSVYLTNVGMLVVLLILGRIFGWQA
jgi:omega-6 fatty acid desaturase (delta-12 desaturase)